jgi:hypothetical protein
MWQNSRRNNQEKAEACSILDLEVPVRFYCAWRVADMHAKWMCMCIIMNRSTPVKCHFGRQESFVLFFGKIKISGKFHRNLLC